MNLFFMIIIQNPLPFYHGCLFLEASNQIPRLDFWIPLLCLFSVFHLFL